MFHYSASSKIFGLDTRDLTEDWVNIYKPENSKILKNHIEKYIGSENWELYESVRIPLREYIYRDWQRKKSGGETESGETLKPVVVLKEENDGKLTWNFPNTFNTSLMSVLGPSFIAAFSPDITTKWPPRIGQDMGATQAIALNLVKKNDLLDSALIHQITHIVGRSRRSTF